MIFFCKKRKQQYKYHFTHFRMYVLYLERALVPYSLSHCVILSRRTFVSIKLCLMTLLILNIIV